MAGSTHAYLEVLLPGVVAQMAMFATMGLGTALAEDIKKGVFDRFRSLPIARSAPLTGAVLGDTARFAVVMAVLTGFGSALGFRFHTPILAVLAAFGRAYVFYLAFCWISVLIGLVAPGPETVQGIAFIFMLPLVFGSSILMPGTATMPGLAGLVAGLQRAEDADAHDHLPLPLSPAGGRSGAQPTRSGSAGTWCCTRLSASW